MSDRKCARMLLEAAMRDLEALEIMDCRGSDEVFGFHVQQAAEKGLKAWIALLGGTYPLTHDLAELMDVLVENGASPESHRPLVAFTPYAVTFRYEGAAEGKSLSRPAALAGVRALLEEIGDLLR